MYFVYVLMSIKDGLFYVGMTSNLDARLASHKDGGVESTKNRRPFKLLGYEAYLKKVEAATRERYLKSSDGKIELRKRFKRSMALHSQGKIG